MKDPPPHWSRVLQGLAHWIAYKSQYFDGHLLPEGAIVAELTQLLSSKISSVSKIECERMYKTLYKTSAPKNLNNRRADIVIGEKPKNKGIHIAKVGEVIEVKRYKEGSFKKIESDFEKLAMLKGINKNVRLFQVIVGQKKVPKKLFNEKHNLFTRDIYHTKNGLKVKLRLARKSYGTKRSGNFGVYAVLAEVL